MDPNSNVERKVEHLMTMLDYYKEWSATWHASRGRSERFGQYVMNRHPRLEGVNAPDIYYCINPYEAWGRIEQLLASKEE